MGPVSKTGQSSLPAPMMTIDGDRMVWRAEVRKLMMNVTECSNGVDTRAEGVLACMEIRLYRYLDICTKEQVKEAISRCQIVLSLDRKDKRKSQNDMVEKIMKLIAKEFPIDWITRMVRLNNKAHECVRRPQESIKKYIYRFAGPALSHLNSDKNGLESSGSHVLGMPLLVYAKLLVQTF